MKLFEEFNPVSYQEWIDKINLDLKGKDYQQTLVWNSPEGIAVQPFYNSSSLADNLTKTVPLKKNTDWKITERINIQSIEEANKKALLALKGGANALLFIGNIKDKNEMNILLKDIQTDIINVHFYNSNPNHIFNITSLTNGSIGYDYLGEMFKTGNWNTSKEEDINQLTILTKQDSSIKNIIIDGAQYGNNGSSIVQELAFSISQGVEYMNLLTDKGINPNLIAQKMQFNFSINSNYFFEIAKIRAARTLWKLVLEQFQVSDTESMYIHSETTPSNFSSEDVHTNILRTTTEAMSAILGGCDSLMILPFDDTIHFSNRIARNIQHILKEESFLDKVNNPADGAYYIEQLTDEIAQKSWSLFQKIEKEGGFLGVLENNFLKKELKKSLDSTLHEK
ncbi:MAG: methylmalonyl-CoA mutase [Vicingus serpentipes]|nr:methylmalonyl-CoA mutase [Vicingus serpentipes]